MYIKNAADLISQLKERLPEYLQRKLKVDLSNPRRAFCCFNHDDKSPSMSLNPKTNYTTAVCFSGCGTFDIFRAANVLENLPIIGGEFITETLPALAEQFGLTIEAGEISQEDKQKTVLYRLSEDISNILDQSTGADEYIKQRGWSKDKLTIGSLPTEEIIEKLLAIGWNAETIFRSSLVKTDHHSFIGEGMVTFVIKDYRGRPVGFVSRNLDPESKRKYLNSADSPIYHKSGVLLGIDVALKEGAAKQNGIYIVEGPGDLASLHRVGIYNAAAICGAAFTAAHLSLLRSLGIKEAYFCLDWDDAGQSSTEKILMNEIKFAPGISCSVIAGPPQAKDPSEFLNGIDSPQPFYDLPRVAGFEWVLQRFSGSLTPENLCVSMVPIIASEPSAIRRETLIKKLSGFTCISYESILMDVESIINKKEEERKGRILGSLQKYRNSVERDPSNAGSLLSMHIKEVDDINVEFKKMSIGPTGQMNRLDALEEQKIAPTEDGVDMTSFTMKHHSQVNRVFEGGLPSTDGNIVYVGGDSNSGKTTFCISIGLDVLVNDPNAIVIMHFTDDNYNQIQPRLLTNIAYLTRQKGDARLTIGQASAPKKFIKDARTWETYQKAVSKLRTYLSEEKLIVLDSENGKTHSCLETQLKHVRTRYPDKKLLLILDNTHNYQDFSEITDKSARIELISGMHVEFVGKYHCCLIATAEHIKKSKQSDPYTISYPYPDELADARALKYNAKVIFQVYQDLHARQENATYYSMNPDTGLKEPRLEILVTKNKLTSAKSPDHTIFVDIDKDCVVCWEVSPEEARGEAASLAAAAMEFKAAVPAKRKKKDKEYPDFVDNPTYDIE